MPFPIAAEVNEAGSKEEKEATGDT
jgi:hypothetical protein